MTEPPPRLLAAEVGKPHGTSGEAYIMRISDDPGRFEPGSVLYRDDGAPLMIETSRPHRNRWLVKFEGIETRDDAESVRGPLFVDPKTSRPLAEDEFWAYELEGCTVHLPDGEEVGQITSVIPGGPHDLLSVTTARGERLVPAVKAIVVAIDRGARRVTIDPPAGLLD